MKRKLVAGLTVALLLMPVATNAADSTAPPIRKLALARQLVEVSGGQAQIRAKLSAMFAASNTISMQSLPEATRTLALRTIQDIQTAFLDATPQLIAISERAYADNLTEKEMSDEIAWLQSDSGRTIREKSTKIQIQVILAEGPLVRDILPGIMQKAIERTCAETQCSDEDRRVIVSAVTAALQRRS